MNQYFVLFIVCWLGAIKPLYSDEITLTQKQLKQITKQITGLKQTLDNSTDKKETLELELKNLDIKIARLSRKLRQTNTELNLRQTKINELKQSSHSLTSQLNKEQEHLSQLILNQYQLGKHEYLQLLLNQQDPNLSNRLLSYFRYIYQARAEAITKVKALKKELTKQQLSLKNELNQYQNINERYKKKQQALAADSHYQQRIITQLDKQISSKQQKLTVYRNNKHRLAQLLQQLKTNTLVKNSQPFFRMRQKLPWPVKGGLNQKLNSRQSSFSGNGISIKAPQGQNIAAIFPGKVVFADWLKGYGLLIILDHGHRYMTLYAHNQSLFKFQGENVQQGETIATVGHSGGLKQNSLYFEIRHNGKPINPLKWLS